MVAYLAFDLDLDLGVLVDLDFAASAMLVLPDRGDHLDVTRPFLADAWTREALRLYGRYQTEIVEACGLCPWAQRARVEHATRTRVLLQEDTTVAPSLSAIDAAVADAEAEVAIFIYPRLHLGRLDFEQFVARVRDADAQRYELGHIPFVMAAFHPDAAPDLTDAERLIPFLRRTPDPTLQLLRATALDRVRGSTPGGTQFVDMRSLEMASGGQPGTPSLRERIARTNLATTMRLGVADLTRRLDDIERERRDSYRALVEEQTETAGGAE